MTEKMTEKMTKARMFLPAWIARLLVVGLMLALVAACGRDNREEEAAPPPAEGTVVATAAPAAAAPTEAAPTATEATATEVTAAPAAPAAGASGDPLSAVTSALTAQIAGGPYRATTRVDTAGTVTEMIAEVIPPDTMHVTIGGGNMEIILLQDTVWSKTGEAAWTQMGSPEMMAGIFDAIRGQTDGSAMSNVQLIGTEPVFGISCDVYSFTSTLGEGEGAVSSEVVLWISKESGLPVRMESSSTHAGVTTTAEQTVEYDDTITIEAPTQ